MASAVAKSGLFGVKTQDQALALMLLAQAEGLHPAIAARDYHLIDGRPALKADAMLARFMASSGRVEWHELTDAKVSATFSHPAGGSLKIEWSIEMAQRAGLATRDNWKKYPRAMLRSRVVSEGIRSVCPGVITGVYTVDEVMDMGMAPAPEADPTVVAEVPAAAAVVVEKAAPVLSEGEISDHTANINAAATLPDLRRAHAAAYNRAHAIDDKAALGKFEDAKNKAKAKLEAKAEAEKSAPV
jgi:hypothetical protein